MIILAIISLVVILFYILKIITDKSFYKFMSSERRFRHRLVIKLISLLEKKR